MHVFLELYLLYRETTRKVYKHSELCYTGLTWHEGDIHTLSVILIIIISKQRQLISTQKISHERNNKNPNCQPTVTLTWHASNLFKGHKLYQRYSLSDNYNSVTLCAGQSQTLLCTVRRKRNHVKHTRPGKSLAGWIPWSRHPRWRCSLSGWYRLHWAPGSRMSWEERTQTGQTDFLNSWFRFEKSLKIKVLGMLNWGKYAVVMLLCAIRNKASLVPYPKPHFLTPFLQTLIRLVMPFEGALCISVGSPHTPNIAFRHLPPNSATTGHAIWRGTLYHYQCRISAYSEHRFPAPSSKLCYDWSCHLKGQSVSV